MTLAERLSAALAASAARTEGLLYGDFEDADEQGRAAAVLIPIVDRLEPGLLLTLRQADLRAHAGQVAFPGGRVDADDVDSIAAALREADEEIGLPPDCVTLVGPLATYHTGTGYSIVPVVGVIPPDLAYAPNPSEVAEVFELPLSHALDRANHIRKQAFWRGRERSYLEIAWGEQRIWGATAAILANLARRLEPAA